MSVTENKWKSSPDPQNRACLISKTEVLWEFWLAERMSSELHVRGFKRVPTKQNNSQTHRWNLNSSRNWVCYIKNWTTEVLPQLNNHLHDPGRHYYTAIVKQFYFQWYDLSTKWTSSFSATRNRLRICKIMLLTTPDRTETWCVDGARRSAYAPVWLITCHVTDASYLQYWKYWQKLSDWKLMLSELRSINSSWSHRRLCGCINESRPETNV